MLTIMFRMPYTFDNYDDTTGAINEADDGSHSWARGLTRGFK
jgi:hypothetical protein